MQDYEALKTVYAGLPSGTIAEKLAAINAMMVDNQPWTIARGWGGPINQNDLVACDILTEQQRIDFEKDNALITEAQATALQNWNDNLADAENSCQATRIADYLIGNDIRPLSQPPES